MGIPRFGGDMVAFLNGAFKWAQHKSCGNLLRRARHDGLKIIWKKQERWIRT
jgi:hypothetical protein